MFRKSLIWRFTLPITLFFIAIIIGLSIFISTSTKKSYLNDLKLDLAADAALLGTDLRNVPLSPGDSEKLNALVERYATILQDRVTIIDSQGVVLGDSESDPAKMDNHLSRPEVRQALNNGIGDEVRYSKTSSLDLYYVAVRYQPVTGNPLIIRMAVPLDEIDARVKYTNQVIWLGGLAVILLAFLLTLLVTSRVLKPIMRLTKATQLVADGNFEDIPQTNAKNEVGKLTKAFNEMGARIRSQLFTINTEKKKFSTIVEQMADGIVIVDENGRIELINPAAERLLGPMDEVITGKTIAQSFRYYQVVDLWKKTLESGKPQNVIIEIKPQQKYLQAISSVLEGTEQPVILLLFQDLSSQRKAEQMRQDFVSNVSHELRTPLASLKALAETTGRSIENDPVNSRYFLSRMDVEIDKLDQMVMELLDLSKIESGRVELNKTSINVYQLLQQSADRMKTQAERAGVKIFLDCSTTLPEIKVDIERIEQVLVNLIHNSVKFTPAGGSITLRADVEHNSMLIRVQDTGAGISAEDLPRIFERFYKTDLARSTGGTGLGLSIAKHVVEAHAGKIWAESIEGSGSTLYFSIPFGQ